MKVIIQVNDGMLSDIMALALEGVLSAECTQVDSGEQAVEILKKNEADLLVVECDTSDSEAITEARRLRIPLIRFSGDQGDLRPSNSDREFVLTKPLEVGDLVELVKYALKGDPDAEKDDAYCQIRLDSLLMAGNQFDFDIFVRLSGRKFVKVVKRGDVFDSEKYGHFLGKGIKHLFVPKEDFVQYLNSMATCLNKLVGSDAVTLESSTQISTQVYESIRDGLTSFGITPETQRVMKLTVNLAVKSINKSPKLKELFATLGKNQDSFQAWHSVALSYISCKLCSLMTWDSQNTHYKLALAAMLHDVGLKNPEWAKFETQEEAKKALTEKEFAEFLQHPLLAGDLVKQLDDFPGDVDYIIAQHHELPDGSGFPLGQSHTKISPLSCLFIVSHDLCHRLHKEGQNFDFLQFLKDFDTRYPLGYFRKIRATLEKLSPSELVG